MRSVLQRVNQASITVSGERIAEIGKGLVALVAISREDTRDDLIWIARKILEVRLFDDDSGKLNLGLRDVSGQLLLISQFTLYGDCRKGRRPSYIMAAPPAEAEHLYYEFVAIVRQMLPGVQTGQFQAMMEVALVNDGPVTLILDSQKAGPKVRQ